MYSRFAAKYLGRETERERERERENKRKETN